MLLIGRDGVGKSLLKLRPVLTGLLQLVLELGVAAVRRGDKR